VFPEATLWYNTSELLLVGAAERAVTLEPARVAAALADPAIASDLSFSLYGGRDRWHVRPEVLHGAFLVGPGGLAAMARGARIERDDRPRLAYAVTRPAAGEEPREIAALAITDLDARTHGGYALWLLTQSRFAESAGHFRHALALGPDDADWRNNLGAALVRLGDLPGAVEEFRRALELNPSMADARQNYEATRAVVEQRARRPSPFTSDTTRAAGG
jgi:tetratricopeptide (TPR) repeat protein